MLGAFMHLIALEAIKIQNTFTSFYMFNISFINCIKKDGPISCVHSVGLAASPPLFLSLWFCSKDVYIYIIFAYYTVYHYIPLCCNYRQNWQLPPVSVTCTCRWPYFSKKVAWHHNGSNLNSTGRFCKIWPFGFLIVQRPPITLKVWFDLSIVGVRGVSYWWLFLDALCADCSWVHIPNLMVNPAYPSLKINQWFRLFSIISRNQYCRKCRKW